MNEAPRIPPAPFDRGVCSAREFHEHRAAMARLTGRPLRHRPRRPPSAAAQMEEVLHGRPRWRLATEEERREFFLEEAREEAARR